jgi:hypothetical protein
MLRAEDEKRVDEASGNVSENARHHIGFLNACILRVPEGDKCPSMNGERL